MTQLDRALDRLAAGDYGDCEDCGESIDPRRLAADPAVTLCGPCREASERAVRPRTL